MKANLALFVADFANGLGLEDWDLEPNPDANGGRVIVVEGNLVDHPEIYAKLCAEAAKLGNYPIDLLACVPPALVVHDGHETFSTPARVLTDRGAKVWDASSVDVREHFPTDREALRIVQYDSCRGLEGWTVINYAFDEFWDYKYRQRLASSQYADDLFATAEEDAEEFASRWAMIPLTRAMDTLVINISAKLSSISEALEKVYGKRADFVEWIKV